MRITTPIHKVHARGRTRYRVVVDVAAAGEKRRQTRRTFDTRKAANAYLARTRAQVDAGSFTRDTAQTFDELADEWLAAKVNEVRANTYYGYESGIRRARAAFGSKAVQRITRSDVEGMVSDLVADKRSKRTTEYALGLVRQCFDRAEDAGTIQRSPARRVKPAGIPAARPTAFTTVELQHIRTAITDKPLEHGFLLTLFGLRRSEVLALTWDSINLDAATLTISASRTESDGHNTSTAPPKSERGRRTLPLDSDTVALLRSQRVAQADLYGSAHGVTGMVVVDELGRPLRPGRYSDEWRDMLLGAGIRYLDLLSARRSSVTAMRDAGVPDHHVAAWHGHDEVVMKRNYSVALDTGLVDAGKALSDTFVTGSPPVESRHTV